MNSSAVTGTLLLADLHFFSFYFFFVVKVFTTYVYDFFFLNGTKVELFVGYVYLIIVLLVFKILIMFFSAFNATKAHVLKIKKH
jgi:hypothetical protein